MPHWCVSSRGGVWEAHEVIASFALQSFVRVQFDDVPTRQQPRGMG